MILCISVILIVMSPFIFNTIYESFSFFVCLMIYQFYLSKETALNFIDVFYVFSNFYLTYSALIFTISFLLLILGLICFNLLFFPTPVLCKVKLLFSDFSFFITFITIYFLRTVFTSSHIVCYVVSIFICLKIYLLMFLLTYLLLGKILFNFHIFDFYFFTERKI